LSRKKVIILRVKLNGNDYFDVSAPFGSIDSVHKTGHTGIDLVMNTGTKLFSPTDGIVSRVVDYGNQNIGKGVIIRTDDGESLVLGHLSDTSPVHVGQHIHKGDFVGLSGNSGHSTGSHLHLGLVDSQGKFVNPDKFLNEHSSFLAEHGGAVTKVAMRKSSVFGDFTGFMDFLRDVKSEGLFGAIYGKSFFEVMKEFFAQFFHDLGLFILQNGDFIFLLPAITVMFATFIIGRNKFTKWIIPLWFGYFVTRVLLSFMEG
jgi:hypothetical protein